MKTLNKRIVFAIFSMFLIANGCFAQNRTQAVVFRDSKVNLIYQDYSKLQKAFAESNAGAIKQAASALVASSKSVLAAKSIGNKALQIIQSKAIKDQRTYFAGISKDVIALVKKSGLKKGELYVIHCPMALDQKGAFWLSNSKEIYNPYFGKAMLKCGSVEETIK